MRMHTEFQPKTMLFVLHKSRKFFLMSDIECLNIWDFSLGHTLPENTEEGFLTYAAARL